MDIAALGMLVLSPFSSEPMMHKLAGSRHKHVDPLGIGAYDMHMITNAMAFIRKELSTSISATSDDILVGDIPTLKSEGKRGIFVSLVNVDHETGMRPMGIGSARTHSDTPHPLGFYLMIAFHLSDYDASLKHLSETAAFFEDNAVFATATSPEVPDGVDKLSVEACPLDIDSLNKLWGILGGTYMPSLLYKVRMTRIAT